VKIVMLTESLGSGGAERQVCTLASEFTRRGHEVRVVTYAPGDFYRPLLERDNIEHVSLGGKGKLSWAIKIRRFLRDDCQDVVLVFLAGPATYAELAGLPSRNWGLVVSERSFTARPRVDVKRLLHGLADYVVTNSHATRLMIEQGGLVPSRKLVTIYNAVRLETCDEEPSEQRCIQGLRLVVAARVTKEKNVEGLLQALSLFTDRHGRGSLWVGWYGNQSADAELYEEMCRKRRHLGLEETIQFHPPTPQIHEIMRRSDAILLPSFYEGLPNTVCEGMMLGKPILMSAVCDAGNLVEEGRNGYLFDPNSPATIAGALSRFAALSGAARGEMGEVSRKKAEALFDLTTVGNHFLVVLEAAAKREGVALEHWPAAVPDTAYAVPKER
jgi:glycosyltransferase involved in cell wall biosynthesis